MNVLTGSITFPHLRGSGPLTGQSTVVFPRTVLHAVAGLTSYSVGFSNEDDHHLGRLAIQLGCSINNNVVIVTVTYGLRDWSGNWDDEYQGVIEFAVIAELEAIGAPSRRTDMAIVDMEFNQATQFFRSYMHLDSQTAMPDNSIRLIGGKNTGVRIYTDYDSSGTGPAVGKISGIMHLLSSSGAEGQISPITPINPISDSAIDRGNSGHTLNFMIPGIWCHDILTIECEIFDNANTSLLSVPFQRILRFVDVVPLRVFCVGIHYTGQALNLPAPTLNDCINTLDWVERVYPTGETDVSGYMTTDFADDLQPSGGGCGDGFNSLIDHLSDLRGGGDETYLGFLPNGGINTQIDTTGWMVTGCDGNGGVSAAFNGDGETSAHEIGHAFGRQHTPCDSSARCDDPMNQNDNYPHYGVYASDSIGEYGYDPINNTVFDPVNVYDFMGYSGTKWVSPYTYSALMQRLTAVDGSPSGSSSPIPMLKRVNGPRKQGMALMLRLSMDLSGKITSEPSFSHEVKIIPMQPPSEYAVEFRDDKGTTLTREPLNIKCECFCHFSINRKIRQTISLHPAATSIAVIYKNKEIFKTSIGTPPEVSANIVSDGKGNLIVNWHSKKKNNNDDNPKIWVIIQGLEQDSTWRGLVYRTDASPIELDKETLLKRRIIKLRLLAVETLATTCVNLDYNSILNHNQSSEGQIVVKMASPGVLKGWVIGNDGIEKALIVWSDEHGSEIGRGKTLDLRNHMQLKMVRAIAINATRRINSIKIFLGQEKEIMILKSVTNDVRQFNVSKKSRSKNKRKGK
jgi:hypothetical protein